MKRLILCLVAGLTISAFGQGSIEIDNYGSAAGYLDDQYLGNHYSGVFGVELWYKNSTAPADDAINSLNGVDPPSAYALLATHGFTLATHINPGAGGTTAVNGLVGGLGEIDIPDIRGNALFGLAFWNGSSTTFLGGLRGGVLTFNNPTADYTLVGGRPSPPATDNWSTDIIMTFIPEPSPPYLDCK